MGQFSHRAIYRAELGRIEISLVSRGAQVVSVGGEVFEFAKGEAISTEYSHKYTVDQFAAMAADAGLTLRREWTDEDRYFAVLHLAIGP